MEKITKEIKTKVNDVNDAKGIVTIQITRLEHLDSDNDRIMKGALTKTWNEGGQVHLVDHKRGLATFVGLPVKKDADNGIIESKINLNKQVGKDLFEDYKFTQENGRSLQHSHGFMPIKDKFRQNEFGGNDYFEIKQFEYSTLLFGAISSTNLIGIKDDVEISSLIDELKLRLRACNYSDEYGKMIENKIKELESLFDTPENKKEPLDALEKAKFINTNFY